MYKSSGLNEPPLVLSAYKVRLAPFILTIESIILLSVTKPLSSVP